MRSWSQTDTGLPRHAGALLCRPGLWPVVLRAGWELALARRALGRRSMHNLLAGDRPGPARASCSARDYTVTALPIRVAWVIPRVATRVPWRADCLVQALAARRWLAQSGIAAELWIGTRKDQQQGFQAHAWVCVDETVITGGNIQGFVPLVTADADRAFTAAESLNSQDRR